MAACGRRRRLVSEDLISELALTDSGAIPPDTRDPDLEKRPAAHVEDKRGAGWVIGIAIFAMAITLLPYLFGYSLLGLNPRFGWYSWLAYNLDDSCVYLSWMRQAADGSLRAFNLFTTEPQHGMALNPFFLLLGWSARLTGLPLLAIYHISRLFFGFVLLLTVWKFIRVTINDRQAVRLGFLFVCFS